MNMFDIAVLWLVVPLKTFQKFCGLNADRFWQDCRERGIETSPALLRIYG